jgi:hypothetical protein
MKSRYRDGWNKAVELKLDKLIPEGFQVVMVASDMLKHMFTEDCLKKELLKSMEQQEKSYITVYGSAQEAMKNAPYLEQVRGSLPISDKIPIADFRLVLNNKLAAIASFFALAIYDEQSFNLALVLLMEDAMKSGEPIPLEDELFLDDDFRMRPDDAMSLFPEEVGVESAHFIKNVVEVLNQFVAHVPTDTKNMKLYNDTGAQTRMAHHQFRTLASDFVEIYVSHGLHPRFGLDWEASHPTLNLWIHESEVHKEEWPLPLIMKYIMLLIQNRQIIVGASHSYNERSKPERKIEFFNAPDDQKLGKDGRGNERPMTRDIRFLYKLVDAKVGMSVRDYNEWLKLPEVVNVILFGLRNVWIKDVDEREDITWTPTLRTLTLAKMGKAKVAKTKKRADTMKEATEEENERKTRSKEGTAKENETEPTTKGATLHDSESDSDNVNESRKAGGVAASDGGYKDVEHPAPLSGSNRSGGKGGLKTTGLYDNESNSDSSEEEVTADEQVEDTEKELWTTFLATADENMIQMIARGRGEVDRRYLEYLDSMKNMGTATCILADLQRKMVLSNCSLVMAEDTDLETIIKDFDKFVLQQKKGPKGTKVSQDKKAPMGVCAVKYGEPEDDTWISVPRRVNTFVDFATSAMMKTLSDKKTGSVLWMEPVTQTGTISEKRSEDSKTGRPVIYDQEAERDIELEEDSLVIPDYGGGADPEQVQQPETAPTAPPPDMPQPQTPPQTPPSKKRRHEETPTAGTRKSARKRTTPQKMFDDV